MATDLGGRTIAEVVMELCVDALDAPDLKVTDVWAARGGDSLAALLVVEMARDVGIEIPIVRFDATITIGGLLGAARFAGDDAEPPATTTSAYLPLRSQAYYVDSAREAGRHELWNSVHVLTLEGPCDRAHLRAAIADLVTRHDALRSRVVRAPDGATWFAPLETWSVPLAERDLSDLSEDEREAACRRMAEEELHRPFDFDTGPLYRFALWRCTPAHHRLLIAAHHSVFDHQSRVRLREDLARAYQAHRERKSAQLGPPAPTLQAFAEWLAVQPTDAAEAYCRSIAPGLEQAGTGLLPVRADAVTGRGWSAGHDVSATVPAEVTRAAIHFAERRGMSAVSLLYGVWSLVLARGSGKPDIYFSTFLSGRRCPFPRADLIVGCLAQTAPVRVTASAEQPASTMLDETHKQLERLRPLDWLIEPVRSPSLSLRDEWLRDPRSTEMGPPAVQLPRTTFFTVLLDKPLDALSFAPLRVTNEAYDSIPLETIDLFATVYPEATWRIAVFGRQRRFTQADVQRLVDTYSDVLRRLEELDGLTLGGFVTGG